MKRILPLILFLSACATAYRSPGPYSGGTLFRNGIYLQDVSIETANGKSFLFQGVLKRTAGKAVITGLSPFGTTVFRIEDDLRKEPRIEIFVEELKARQDKVQEFYGGLRPMFQLKDAPGTFNAFVRERFPDGRPSRLTTPEGLELLVEEYDRDGNVEKLKVKGPHFETRIKLREYRAEGAPEARQTK